MYQAWRRPGRNPRTVHISLCLAVSALLTTERKVDDAVCTADASLDPDSERGEDDSQDGQETVAAAHIECMIQLN